VATVVTVALLSWGMLTGEPMGHPQIPVLFWFACFMLANSLRWISISTLTSKVPLPHQRGRYMSILSAIQHLSSSTGAVLSTKLLHTNDNGSLDGIPQLAITAMIVGIFVPAFVRQVELKLKHRKPLPHQETESLSGAEVT
jgi:hypothetical protein